MFNLNYKSTGQGIEKAEGIMPADGREVKFTLKRPDLRKGGRPVNDGVWVLVDGWTEGSEALEPLSDEIAAGGMACVTTKSPRYLWPNKALRAAELHVEDIATVVEGLNEHYGPVYLGGHSLGGFDAVRAIHKHKLKVNVLALMASAGLIVKPKFHQVAPRVLKAVFTEEVGQTRHHPIREAKFAKVCLERFGQNVPQAVTEGWGAATGYVGNHITELTEQDIIVVNMIAEKDGAFPYRQVLDSTAHLPIDQTHIFPDYHHNFPFHQPKETGEFLINLANNADTLRGQRF